MKKSLGARTRAALTLLAATGLALLGTAPAHAAGGTPTTPTQLFNGYLACAADPTAPIYLAGRLGVLVEGIPGDTDATIANLTEQFQYWPVSDPTQVGTASASSWNGNEASATTATLVNGQTYGWQARTVDPSGATSDWSAPCYVAADDTPPTAPTVTSPNYPPGQLNQGGTPVQLVFDAHGVSDVAGFQFSWNGTFPVVSYASLGPHGVPQPTDPYSQQGVLRANPLGGSATMSVIPPPGGGVFLWVRSFDRAFNSSDPVVFQTGYKPDAPTITELSHSLQFGATASFKLAADPGIQAASHVVSFTVEHDTWEHQTRVTVPASDDGTAEVDIPLNGSAGDDVEVSTTSADGWVSSTARWNVYRDTTPTVTSDVYPQGPPSGGAGVPGTFTFTPKINGSDVASDTYSLNFGPETTVPAGAHGTAQITWTPSESGWYLLVVHATTTDGIQLTASYYDFGVN